MNNKRSHIVSYCLLLLFSVVLLTLISACGRRGDPFLPSPVEKKEVLEDSVKSDEPKESTEKKSVVEEKFTRMPDAPSGLDVLYTGKSIVLSWRENQNQRISYYNIYRSSGDNYVIIGDSMVPVFIDREIKEGMTYFYRVTAVGISEGPWSEIQEIKTEGP